jgi:DNA-binding phage protein
MEIEALGESHSVYQQFAKNLRARVLERGSIAQICLNLKINRQQFNKYLSGAVLPNEITMGKIVTYLGVELVQLFEDKRPVQQAHDKTSLPNLINTEPFDQVLTRVYSESSMCSLTEGVYFCYAPWLPNVRYCIRSIVIVKRIDEHLVFTRLVRINEPGVLQRKYKSRMQVGIVTQHGNIINMLGADPRRDQLKMMISCVRDNSAPHNLMGGLISTYTPVGLPASFRVVLHFQGAADQWRQLYRKSGTMAIEDPSIRPDAAAIILKYFHDENAMLHTYDVMKGWRT